MQNRQSLHLILDQLDKLKENIQNLNGVNSISSIEIDLALEKLRGIYDELLQKQNGNPKEKRFEQQENEYLDSFEVEDILDEASSERSDFEMEESSEVPVKAEMMPEPEINEIKQVIHSPAEKKEELLPHPVEIGESPASIEAQVKPPTVFPFQKEKKPVPEPIILQTKQPVQKEEIIQPKRMVTYSEEISEKTTSQESSVEKKTYPKENSGKVIGDQLGADKKSLYDLISGNKADKDIVSQFKKQPVTDIHKAVSLNDKIWFTKELFNNDGAMYKKYVDLLNQCNGLEEGLNIITTNFEWDSESRVVQKFLSIVSRRFI